MTFLPIVARELSVASRRKATFWTRLVFASLAVVVGAATLGYVALVQPRPGLGAGVFAALSGLGFAFCALAGVFLSADGLSEEKREGTLGLLFLTDVRGYDVVLGKLVANSLTAGYGLLAMFPVLGFTLVLGGVTAGEFWRMALLLLNTLLLSLATGLCVSALSRENQRAMTATVAVLLGLVVLPPVAGYSLSLVAVRVPAALLQFSPLWGWMRTFDSSYLSEPRAFWRCVVAVQAVSWSLLLLAAVVLPRVWQEGRTGFFRRPAETMLTDAARARRQDQRREWMTTNPIRWLALRGSAPIWSHWAVFAVLGLLSLLSPVRLPTAMAFGFFGWIPALILRAAVAIEAGRFFAESRQTGALEMLRCAPLSAEQLLDGPCHALIRRFWLPVLIVVVSQLAPLLVALGTAPGNMVWGWVMSGVLSGLASLGLVLDLFAIAWIGMLIGLTCRKPGRAAGYTVLWMVLLPRAIPCSGLINVFVDLPLIFWARSRLHIELGARATSAYRPAASG